MSALLSPEEKDTALESLPGWAMVQGRDAIEKTFRFADFNAAFAFMTRAAEMAEEMDHHPEWFNVYNRVEVTLTTHDAGQGESGVTAKDIALAQAMEEYAATPD